MPNVWLITTAAFREKKANMKACLHGGERMAAVTAASLFRTPLRTKPPTIVSWKVSLMVEKNARNN